MKAEGYSIKEINQSLTCQNAGMYLETSILVEAGPLPLNGAVYSGVRSLLSAAP